MTWRLIVPALLLWPSFAHAQDVPAAPATQPAAEVAPPAAPVPLPVAPAAPPVPEDSAAEADAHAPRVLPPIAYEPGAGIVLHADKASLRFFLGVETVLLYGHCEAAAGVCEATDLMTTHVRRARLDVEANLPHHLFAELALQIKNEQIVLKKASIAWKHDRLTLRAGFLKPPGGIERDSSTWVKAFPERSVVANFKQDRVLGVMASKWVAGHTFRLQAAVGRPPAGNFDAFEKEDVVLPPAGVEEEDLTTDPGNWDLFATGAYTPSSELEIGLNTTAHIAPDAGRGPNFAEPYETQILKARYFSGAFLAAGADVSWHGEHARASAEAVVFRSGDTIPQRDSAGNALEPTDAPEGAAGYVVLGYTPSGAYGPALENSPLLKGYQLLLRGEFLTVTPGVTADARASFASVTGGVEWQLYRQLRLQTDLAMQKFNEGVVDNNHNAWRLYGELWAQVLL